MELGIFHYNYPLIDITDHTAYKWRPLESYYVNVNTRTKDKERILNQIASRLGVRLRVESNSN